MKYTPSPVPLSPSPQTISEYLQRELYRISNVFDDSVISRALDASGAVSAGDSVLLVDASSATAVLSLPVASLRRGYTVKKTTAGNSVILDADGSETIDGSVTYAISAQYGTVSVASDGSAWYTV